MTNFDIVEKIKLNNLTSALFKKASSSPYQLLQREGIVADGWKDNYFDWGRNALYWLFKSLKFKAVAFPEFTCPTLIWAAKEAKKKVVLVDSDLNTFNLNIDMIPRNINCLVVVHTFGNPVNIEKIRKRFKKLFIIEDCAHALFSKINNSFVGSQGDAILFSLYKQVVNINGSVLLTKKQLVKKQKQDSSLKYLKRLVFKTDSFHQRLLDFKRHQYLPEIEQHSLTDNKPSSLAFYFFQKGFLILKKEVEERKKVANWYYDQVRKSKYLISQQTDKDSQLSYYNFSVRLIDKYSSIRDRLVFNLRKKNIFLGRLWHNSVDSSILSKTVINLPISSAYKKKDVEYLFSIINEVIKQTY